MSSHCVAQLSQGLEVIVVDEHESFILLLFLERVCSYNAILQFTVVAVHLRGTAIQFVSCPVNNYMWCRRAGRTVTAVRRLPP